MRRAFILVAACIFLAGVGNTQSTGKPAAPSACVPIGDTTDLQVFPSCSLKQIITQAFGVIKPFLKDFPFEDKAACYEKTDGLIPEVAATAFLPCLHGNCSNIFGSIMSAIYPAGMGLDELQRNDLSNLTKRFKWAYEEATEDIKNSTLKMICPEAGERPPFMALLPETLNRTELTMEVAENVENVLGMLFNDPEIVAKSTDEGGCKFFKDNIEGAFNGIDFVSVLNSVAAGNQAISTVTTMVGGVYVKQGQKMISKELEDLFCKSEEETAGHTSGASATTTFTSLHLAFLLMVFLGQLL